MKRTLAVSFALYLAVFLIPLLSAGQIHLPEQSPEPPEEALLEASPSLAVTAEAPPLLSPSPSPSPPSEVMITVLIDRSPQEITLRDFLCGSVAAEMPALYPEEALKAQAVAIRTLALYAQKRPYHENARLCADFECCLAFSPLPEREADWGGQYEELAQKIMKAVDETAGVAILYEGEPIEAVFFAATDGRTRSAAEVWGGEVPYLQSVGSEFDAEFPSGPRGHGVGMSQFGARQLALAGLSYKEILQWYYTEVEVTAQRQPTT
ncbi:MAG: SpoIID/LytB domain-containing protein [Oscillospiraceae bacterium]|jgi:stage II sporulation protein D|nr:SpoIID/LytB domain-containing protein [Oscillospiraceae bacterium]